MLCVIALVGPTKERKMIVASSVIFVISTATLKVLPQKLSNLETFTVFQRNELVKEYNST